MGLQDQGVVGFWENFEKKISFIDQETHIIPSKDANSPLALPQGCKLVQIAYWSEASGVNDEGTLYVDKNLWVALDQLNKIALLAHEYFFKLARQSGFKSSDFVRNKIAHLLSQEGLPPMFPGWVSSKDVNLNKIGLEGLLPEKSKGYKVCFGDNRNPGDKMSFIQYQDKDGLQAIVWFDVVANNIVMPPFEKAYLSFDPNSKDTRLITFASDNVNMDQTRKSYDRDKFNIERTMEDWTGSIYDQDGRIFPVVLPLYQNKGSVALKNPNKGFILVNERETRPKEELIKLLQLDVMNLVFEEPKNSERIKRNDFYNALFVLNKEIDELFKGDNWPTEFPKWTAELQKMEAAGVSLGKERKYIYNGFPHYLARFKYGVYTNEDVNKSLGNAGFVKVWRDGVYGGRVLVNIANEVIEYETSCYGYDEHYDIIVNTKAKDNPTVGQVSKPAQGK
jgi:hypothetical protein